MGSAAFEGGIATAPLGVLLHFFTPFVLAGALLYGFGVVVVMNLTVLPLSGSGR